MKWLILLVLLLVVIFVIAMRYRRHLQTAWQVWRMFRQFKKATKPAAAAAAEKEIEARGVDKNEPLVRCARCGKWVARSEALNLRSKTVYCSTNCMEKAARIESLVDKS